MLHVFLQIRSNLWHEHKKTTNIMGQREYVYIIRFYIISKFLRVVAMSSTYDSKKF
jgi:hypothetical protein